MYWLNDKTRRYYHAIIERDLLGDLVVTRTTGGCGTNQGRIMTYPVNGLIEANKMLDDVSKDRERHGYRLVDSVSYHHNPL